MTAAGLLFLIPIMLVSLMPFIALLVIVALLVPGLLHFEVLVKALHVLFAVFVFVKDPNPADGALIRIRVLWLEPRDHCGPLRLEVRDKYLAVLSLRGVRVVVLTVLLGLIVGAYVVLLLVQLLHQRRAQEAVRDVQDVLGLLDLALDHELVVREARVLAVFVVRFGRAFGLSLGLG